MDFLNDKINEEVNNNVIPGMTYAIVTESGVNIGSSGFKSLIPNKETITDDTIYDIASLTKILVVVTLISKLLDKKIIKLSDKIKDYLPNFIYDDITIYHLLTHTSGLPADLSNKSIKSKEQIRNEIYLTKKEYSTGSKVIYSDLGYIILGDMISKIYGKSLDVISNEEIFNPLNMKNTCFNPSNKELCAPTEITKERGLVKGIVHDEKAYSLGGVAGHAGVFTTTRDLSNFVKMVLNNGIFDNKIFLSKAVIDLWFKPLVYDEKCEWYRSFSYIVGNDEIVIKRDGNIISFNGFTGPSISIDRDNNLGIILMTNRVHPTRANKKISQERPKISEEIYKKLVKEKSIK